MKFTAKDLIIIGAFGIGIWGLWKLYNLLGGANGIKGTANFWQNALSKVGLASPPATITNITGEGSQPLSMDTKSQGFYNAALQEYSYNAGDNSTLDGQGSTGWPWTSYDNWKSEGYPTLPTASFVTFDPVSGMYGNEY